MHRVITFMNVSRFPVHHNERKAMTPRSSSPFQQATDFTLVQFDRGVAKIAGHLDQFRDMSLINNSEIHLIVPVFS